MGVELGDSEVLAPELSATVSALAAHLASAAGSAAVEAVAAAVADEVTSQTRPAPLGPLAQLRAVETLGPETALSAATGSPVPDHLPRRRAAASAAGPDN